MRDLPNPVAHVRFGAEGLADAEVAARLAALVAELPAPDDAARALALRLETLELAVPLERDAEDEPLFEAWRRMNRSWDVAQPPELRSHRRVIGRAVVAAKRLLHRLLAVELGPILERQARFNKAAVDLLLPLFAELGRLRARVRELEARVGEPPVTARDDRAGSAP